MHRLEDPKALASLREDLRRRRERHTHTVTVCAGTPCRDCGCLPVAQALRCQIFKHDEPGEVHFRMTGCHGFCEQGPLVVIEPGDIFYRHVKPEDAEDIVKRTLKGGEIIERLLCREGGVPSSAGRDCVALGENRKMSPTEIDDYIAIGGYAALEKALSSMTPEEIIEEVKVSGLHGRGEDNQPTGGAWEECKAVEGQEQCIVCTADEDDPGSSVDRMLLEGNPHSVLEGMIIGAFAIGGRRGFVHVREKDALAARHMRTAVQQAGERGLLGENILGTGRRFEVKVVEAENACTGGESVPPAASGESEAREPAASDAQTVETWASVPRIILNGSECFGAKGTGGGETAKTATLAGHVAEQCHRAAADESRGTGSASDL